MPPIGFRISAALEVVGGQPLRPEGAIQIILKLRNHVGERLPLVAPTLSIRDPLGNTVVDEVSMSISTVTNEATYVYQPSAVAVEGTYLCEAHCTRQVGGVTGTFRASGKFVLSRLLD